VAPAVTPTLDVVVLAGGASRRMGRDKARLVYAGHRLVDGVATRMATVAERVWIACGPRSLGRPDEIPDAPGCTGPLAGIVAALGRTDADLLGIVPVDAPDTPPAVLARLAVLCAAEGRAAAVVTADGHLQALHAVVARAATPAVTARVAAGERSPRRLLAWLDARRVDVDGWGDLDPTGAMARDWDRPEDLPADVRLD
jgi:molybdopterin-guanine dinucleotide biosynthesis protein A